MASRAAAAKAAAPRYHDLPAPAILVETRAIGGSVRVIARPTSQGTTGAECYGDATAAGCVVAGGGDVR